jgi:hypothetical protein
MIPISRLTCLLWSLVAAPVLAEELSTTAQADAVAPTPCCDAAIVPAGHFEIEANYSGDGVRGAIVHTSNLAIKYSLTNRLQLQLATANLFVFRDSARAFDGVSPGLKLVLTEEGEFAPQLAVSAHAVFPTLTIDAASQTTIDSSLMVYASKDIRSFHLDATINLTVANLGGAPLAQGGASLTASWNFSDQWSLATGPYSSFGNAQRLGVDGGWFGAVNFFPIPQFAFTAGAEAGFYHETRDFSFFAGVAWVPTANAPFAFAAAAEKPSGQLVASR